jgi:SAM-dependent methyltransferase
MPETLSRRWRRYRRYLDHAALDFKLFVTGKRDPELPPHRYRQIGPGDFRERGAQLAALLVRNGLEEDHRVLDIGCGIGRVALGLTKVLSPAGSYEGFDADARAIRWCQHHLTPRYPRFRFTHAEIDTARHNPRGVPAAEYRFPWPDASFDFAFATSVLTHLKMDAAKRYVAEAGRVLPPGGIFVATVFVDDGRPSKLAFPIDRGDHRLMDRGDGVAFLESSLGALLPAEQWSDVAVQRGSWQTGGTFSVLTQDVITARRRLDAELP